MLVCKCVFVPVQTFMASAHLWCTLCLGVCVYSVQTACFCCCFELERLQIRQTLQDSPLWDMPTDRHFWKRQYWHLLRFFFWILHRRSHLSYSSFSRMVLRKKPWIDEGRNSTKFVLKRLRTVSCKTITRKDSGKPAELRKYTMKTF